LRHMDLCVYHSKKVNLCNTLLLLYRITKVKRVFSFLRKLALASLQTLQPNWSNIIKSSDSVQILFNEKLCREILFVATEGAESVKGSWEGYTA